MRYLTPTLLALTLLAAGAPRARAQHTTFDFEAPGPAQSGSYAPDSGAELVGGEARLVPRDTPPWFDAAWPYRLGVTITNPGPATLTGHPVRISLDGAPAALFDRARLDGADLLPVRTDLGTELSARWVESFDFISRSGVLWVKVPTLPPGSTAVQIYFGNPTWSAPGTAEAFFADPAGWVTQCVVSPVAAQLDLVLESFVDGNTVTVGSGSSVLDTRDSTTVAAAQLGRGTCVAATGAFYGTFAGDDADALVPLAFASTFFVTPALRYDDEWDVVSPFGDATVSVWDNATLVTTQLVGAATPLTIAADVTNGHEARLVSDLPVLVHHRGHDPVGGTDSDAYALVPASVELLGANSATTYLVAEQDGTVVDAYYSGGTHESFTLDASAVRTLSVAGNQGSGDAVHLLASAPIMAISQGDGDGGESVSFLPARELGRRFLIPRAAQYVLVATLTPATTCRVLDLAGAEVTSQQSNNYAPHYPNRLLFGAVAAGHELSCDAQVWAMFEDSATDTERNLWPVKLHRPRVADEPVAALAALQTRYASERGTVITPTFTAPYAVETWTAFLETAVVPTGASLRYQLSDDDGQTWRFFDGEAWLPAASDDEASPGWQVHYAMELFPVDGNRLTVKAILGSAEGAVSPSLDELRVHYAQVQSAERLVFDPVGSPQTAGVPFEVTITATDADGHRIAGYSEVAGVQTLGGTTSPAFTPPFVDGQVTFEVAVHQVGPAVELYAYQAAITGTSTPFEVVAADAATLELVSGDQQFGMAGTELADPLVVQVTTSEGAPAVGVEVTFAVTEGEGTVGEEGGEPVSLRAVTTDGAGEAEVRWTLGPPPGAQRVQARLDGASGSPVTFVARADPDPDSPYYELRGEGGGCSCRHGGGAPGAALPLLLWGLLLWVRRRA